MRFHLIGTKRSSLDYVVYRQISPVKHRDTPNGSKLEARFLFDSPISQILILSINSIRNSKTWKQSKSKNFNRRLMQIDDRVTLFTEIIFLAGT